MNSNNVTKSIRAERPNETRPVPVADIRPVAATAGQKIVKLLLRAFSTWAC